MIAERSHDLPVERIRVSLITFFVVIGLLRLTNLNYYLSQLVGLPTTVDHTGGGAFNFTNYIAIIGLGLILLARRDALITRWRGLWPYVVLIGIYLSNALLAPYANFTWVGYQILFILVAVIMHVYARRLADTFADRFGRSIRGFYWVMIGFVVFCTLVILSQYSLSYYVSEYNDSFVHALDDFGVMKQRYGYLLGFVVSYTIFYVRGSLRWMLLGLLLFAGFGIRSFVIGLIGAAGLFTLKRPRLFLTGLTISTVVLYFVLASYFDNIIFDTRFYSFYNAYHILQEFAFGVGLGGYPVYTELFSSSLFAQFYHVDAVLDFVPTAPESDIVHLIGSLGLVAGLIHLLIQGRTLWLTHRLQRYLTRFDRCILFYFAFMTFFGISEDSIFSVNYWIFFGISTGLIAAAARRRHLLKSEVK